MQQLNNSMANVTHLSDVTKWASCMLCFISRSYARGDCKRKCFVWEYRLPVYDIPPVFKILVLRTCFETRDFFELQIVHLKQKLGSLTPCFYHRKQFKAIELM